MARSSQNVNSQVRGTALVYSSANAPISGLAQGNFTVLVSKDGVDQGAYTVTITEIGNGRYGYVFVPNAKGYWLVLIRNAANDPRGWIDEFDVS